MSLKAMAQRILRERSGTACGTGCPTGLPVASDPGIAENRMNTGQNAKCLTVPNLYTGTVGHPDIYGTPGGTPAGTPADLWGEDALLVQWFLSVRDTLPRERFIYDQGEGWQVIWATPTASYQILAAEIEKGPGGKWDAEVRSILERLQEMLGSGREVRQ